MPEIVEFGPLLAEHISQEDFRKYFNPLNYDDDDQSFEQYDSGCEPVKLWVTPGGYLTVKWENGEKTTVHAEDPEHASVFAGFCIAYAKRIFGSTTNIKRAIEQCATNANAKSIERKRRHEQLKSEKAYNRKVEEAKREARIKEKMEELYNHREALRRIHEADKQEALRKMSIKGTSDEE